MTATAQVLSKQTMISSKQTMRLIVTFLVIFWLLCAARFGYGQNLMINNQKGNQKETLMFTVSVKNTPNSVQSFGFEVHYDPQILEYIRYEKGKIAEGYKFFDCVQIKPGLLRCGGFTDRVKNIPAGQSGEVVNLYFQKLNCRNTILSLQNLVDDLKGWKVADGRFTCWRN